MISWAYAGAAALASQRQPTLAPEALSKAKPGKSPPLSLDQINKVYDNGHPSNKVSAGPGSAGLVVHMYDLTERVGTGQMYQPGDAQFQKFWATSIVNRNMPGTYEPPTGGGPCNGVGILINPEAAKVLCSCAWDFTSWNSGCAASSDLYTPDKLEAMLNVSSQKQADPNVDTFGGKYNEVIIDSAEYRDQLPTAIAAVFFTQEPDCATRTHPAPRLASRCTLRPRARASRMKPMCRRRRSPRRRRRRRRRRRTPTGSVSSRRRGACTRARRMPTASAAACRATFARIARAILASTPATKRWRQPGARWSVRPRARSSRPRDRGQASRA